MLRSGNRVKLIAAREYGTDANQGCWRLAAWGRELTLRAGRTARSCEASWFQGVRVVEVSAFNDSDPLILGCQLQAAVRSAQPAAAASNPQRPTLSSFSHGLDDNPLGPLAVPFPVENALPRAEIELALRHRDDDLVTDRE